MRECLEALRDVAARRGVDFMDVRAVEEQATTIGLQDGRADKVSRRHSRGLGIRVLLDRAWGFTCCDGWQRDRALESLDTAIAMARASQTRLGELGVIAGAAPIESHVEAKFEIDPRSISLNEKMQLLRQYEQAAVAVGDGKLVNTHFGYSDAVERVLLCNTRGTLLETETVHTMVSADVTARDGDICQGATEHWGEQCGYELMNRTNPDEIAAKATRRAVALLKARRAPAGKFTVVLDSSISGLLTHEALGHNAEADNVLAGESLLAGKLGRRVAADCITIIDDATMEGSWGSYAYDSEGTPAQRRVLVENGMLKGYMHSLETAARFGTDPNGSARARGYAHRPVVRMSNTFIAPGEMTLEQLIGDIDEGVYLKAAGWGHAL